MFSPEERLTSREYLVKRILRVSFSVFGIERSQCILAQASKRVLKSYVRKAIMKASY